MPSLRCAINLNQWHLHDHIFLKLVAVIVLDCLLKVFLLHSSRDIYVHEMQLGLEIRVKWLSLIAQIPIQLRVKCYTFIYLVLIVQVNAFIIIGFHFVHSQFS